MQRAIREPTDGVAKRRGRRQQHSQCACGPRRVIHTRLCSGGNGAGGGGGGSGDGDANGRGCGGGGGCSLTGEELNRGQGDEQAQHGAALHAGVVRVERRDVRRKRHAEAQVDRDPAGEGKHAHARVLELSLQRV